MLRVGLTGGIATGKSTVGVMLQKLGCYLLEADKIAHFLMEPGGATYDEIVREFGREIVLPDGRVDRKILGGIVFAEPSRLARLNAIVHPRVLAEQDRALAIIERSEPHAIGIVEAALLIEAGYSGRLDFLAVTWCTPEQQLSRLMLQGAGRGLTAEQARRRIEAQMPLEEKKRLGDGLIDCSGSLEQTQEQTLALYLKWQDMEAGRIPRPREKQKQ